MAYNGWTNKETWLVNLWLGDILSDALESGDTVNADYVESLVESIYELEENTPRDMFIRDLLSCALGEINYQEIAEHFQENN